MRNKLIRDVILMHGKRYYFEYKDILKAYPFIEEAYKLSDYTDHRKAIDYFSKKLPHLSQMEAVFIYQRCKEVYNEYIRGYDD